MDTTGKKRRRRFTNDFRCQVVEEALGGTASVSEVARRHDLNTNQLFNWRRRYLDGKLNRDGGASLVPIRLAPPIEAPQAATPPPSLPVSPGGTIDVVLAAGHRLSVRGDVDPAVLRLMLEALR